jgi:hypothetical protein
MAVSSKSFSGLTSGKFLDAQMKKSAPNREGWTPN